MTIVLTATLVYSCKNTDHSISRKNPLFTEKPLVHPVPPGEIDEASGIAESKTYPGSLWVEQDSGNPPELRLLGTDGRPGKRIFIKNAVNRDWEDLVLVQDGTSNTSQLYIGDIGDNFLQQTQYSIYHFPEPGPSTDTVYTWQKINFVYPDGAHDAEAFLVDQRTRDIFIITKNDAKAKIFRLASPPNSTALVTASLVGELPFGVAVSAAMSTDSKEIIVKTYTDLYYWTKQADEPVDAALRKAPLPLPYQAEIQGEAVCFARDGSGFYTLSEKPASAASVGLNFYKRN
jgi:hypothetical protein